MVVDDLSPYSTISYAFTYLPIGIFFPLLWTAPGAFGLGLGFSLPILTVALFEFARESLRRVLTVQKKSCPFFAPERMNLFKLFCPH